MVQEYKLDTQTRPGSSMQTSEDIPNHDPIVALNLEYDMQYDASSTPTVLRDGLCSGIIDDFIVKDGAVRWLHIKGIDLYYLSWLLMRNAPTKSDVDNSATNETKEMNLTIPVALNPEQAKNLKLVIEWQGLDYLLSGGTTNLDSATLGGTVVFASDRQNNFKIIPILDQVNKTTSFKTKLDTEGRLEALLILSRLNASPYSLSNQLTELTLRIEGMIKRNVNWTTAQMNFQNVTGDAYVTGIGLIPVPELFNIGNNCFLSGDLGATATDITIYQIFRPLDMARPIVKPAPGLVSPDAGKYVQPVRVAPRQSLGTFSRRSFGKIFPKL